MPRGVIGNTSDSGSEESRFEPWRGSKKLRETGAFLCYEASLKYFESYSFPLYICILRIKK